MQPPRITGVRVYNHHTLPDLEIDLNGQRHLVLTGPNGSGKTTLLAGLAAEVASQLVGPVRVSRRGIEEETARLSARPSPDTFERQAYSRYQAMLASLWVEADWTPDEEARFGAREAGAVCSYLPADRATRVTVPTGPSRLEFSVDNPQRLQSADLGRHFLQLLVNLHTSMHLFRSEEPEESRRIELEIQRLRDAFRDLFVAPDLEFVFDKRDYRLTLRVGGHEPPWEHLAAGHQAVLAIVADVYTRVNAVEGRDPASGGVVLIDEPELHLHPEMQERVLPALAGLFPDLQLIVATHAPPVISSLPDAWVYDLRTREGIASRELQGRPYGSLMRSHFQVPTDYDVQTTTEVEALVRRASEASTELEKRQVRDELTGFLVTEDDRVLEWWNRLSLELGAP